MNVQFNPFQSPILIENMSKCKMKPWALKQEDTVNIGVFGVYGHWKMYPLEDVSEILPRKGRLQVSFSESGNKF